MGQTRMRADLSDAARLDAHFAQLLRMVVSNSDIRSSLGGSCSVVPVQYAPSFARLSMRCSAVVVVNGVRLLLETCCKLSNYN